MDLVHFFFLLLLGTGGLTMVAVPPSVHDDISTTKSVNVIDAVVEELLPGNIHTGNIIPIDDTIPYHDTTVPDTLVDERAFPPTNGYTELMTWDIYCNYSEPLRPPMVYRPSLAWCRQMLRCHVNGYIIAGMYPGPSPLEQQSWNWCMESCSCIEVDRPASHYKANFGCPRPNGGYINGAVGASHKREEATSSDPEVTEFIGGLVLEQNRAAHNEDDTSRDWPEVITAEAQNNSVKIGYDPTDPTWQNPIYMLTSCTLYPAMDADGQILAMAKMMDWCGCENRLNTESASYGGMSVYDPATNVRVWACRYVSSNKHPETSITIPIHLITLFCDWFQELTESPMQRRIQYALR